ncbi:MAG: hypothetical protein ACOYXT_13770 [Bacteroidota bacterium]
MNNLIYAKMIVRIASLYNASALVFFLLPNGLSLLGVMEPYSSFWRVLPGLLAAYGAIVLWLSSGDVMKYASFSFWNGVVRLVFVTVVFIVGYQDSVGSFVLWLAIGDLPLGILTIYFVKAATGKSISSLLTNKNV